MQRSLETIKFLTFDEIKRLIKVIEDKRDRALFLLAYRHGLRASEVGMLRTSDFNDKELKLMCHRAKGSVSGVHPMQPDEVRILKAYLRHRKQDTSILFPSNRSLPISRITLHKWMKEYGKRADLPEDKRHLINVNYYFRLTCEL